MIYENSISIGATKTMRSPASDPGLHSGIITHIVQIGPSIRVSDPFRCPIEWKYSQDLHPKKKLCVTFISTYLADINYGKH